MNHCISFILNWKVLSFRPYTITKSFSTVEVNVQFWKGSISQQLWLHYLSLMSNFYNNFWCPGWVVVNLLRVLVVVYNGTFKYVIIISLNLFLQYNPFVLDYRLHFFRSNNSRSLVTVIIHFYFLLFLLSFDKGKHGKVSPVCLLNL